jgi:fructokinase
VTGRALCGAVEAGGTKFVCAAGCGPDDLPAIARVPTTTPAETLGRVVAFFRDVERDHGRLAAIGVASFGPVELRRDAARYGFITSTPKPGWADTDVAGPLRAAFGVPVGFDTDVNGAALAEGRWGAARDVDTFAYLTVGTGIGGGAVVGGVPVHGLVHPEMGHLRVPHDRVADPFEGVCPFHGDCLEGLASGPALAARWGAPAESLPPDHPAWALEAHYLALALHGLVCTLSPQRLVMGGGVMSQAGLLPLVRRALADSLAGYIRADALAGGLDAYVVPPGLGDRAGVLGALALGLAAAGLCRAAAT